MTRRTHASRSGITLTEILIGIMIMGIGLVDRGQNGKAFPKLSSCVHRRFAPILARYGREV